jgi:hypothetical protein
VRGIVAFVGEPGKRGHDLSKDETIAELRLANEELQADKRRLLDMLQVALDSQRMAQATQEDRRAKWRHDKQKQRKCPEDIPQDILTDIPQDIFEENEKGVDGPLGGSPPGPPFPVTPLNPPKARASRAKGEYSPEFGTFWEAYPARDGVKVEKREAAAMFDRWVKPGELDDLLRAVRNYAASSQKPKDAFRWLRDGDWQEWLTQEPSAQDGPVRLGPDSDYVKSINAELDRRRAEIGAIA